MKVLLVCPLSPEFNACREALALGDCQRAAGYRAARGAVGSVELAAVKSGPGKARAARATLAGCSTYAPDLVVDSGSCAGTDPDAAVGQILICRDCYEYELNDGGLPSTVMPETRHSSALSLLKVEDGELLFREAGQAGSRAGLQVRAGNQACGEFLVRSQAWRAVLFSLFRAVGTNWETAGVFTAARKSLLPAISIRVVTDLGDKRALRDFFTNVKKKTRELYGFIGVLADYGWFSHLLEGLRKI